jgi:hypothetical protein
MKSQIKFHIRRKQGVAVDGSESSFPQIHPIAYKNIVLL